MKYLILIIILFFPIISYAQSNCTTNAAGDVTCQDHNNPNVTYTTESAKTLAEKVQAQAVIKQQRLLAQQQETLNNTALQEIIANQIANDKALSAQQAAITKSLNDLQAQTK
jgi:hypothetical protein